jgi:hypothetical protein
MAEATEEEVSRLLTLPRELRDEIYDHAFTGENIPIVSQGERVRNDRWELYVLPGILRANKQIRDEALPRFFARATFILEDVYVSRHERGTIDRFSRMPKAHIACIEAMEVTITFTLGLSSDGHNGLREERVKGPKKWV